MSSLFLAKLKCDVWDNYPKAKSLDTNLLVSVLSFCVKELHDVWVMGIKIDCPSTLPSTKLISIAKAVFQ
jgi:hypothetical protein